MLKPLSECLTEAAKDGEIITVIYSAGNHPGFKRRVLPVRVAGHLLYARESPSLAVKSFLIDSLSIVDEDYPAPWVDVVQSRQPARIIEDPVIYFIKWSFVIRKPLWPALGVSLREYVDKERSAVLRTKAKNSGFEGSVKQFTVKYLAYAVSSPPAYDFEEGDVFYSANNKLTALQVVARRKLLEVHLVEVPQQVMDTQSVPYRSAYQLIDAELADWLHTGVVPIHARIDAAQSYSDILRFNISSPQLSGESVDSIY
jgi:hypothetical protein